VSGPASRGRREPIIRKWTAIVGCGLAFGFACLHGCFTPPVVLETPPAEPSLVDFPPGTELVEVLVDDGVALRGVFVPGRPGGPVTLHLMEAMASIGFGAVPFGDVSLGYASDAAHQTQALVVDDYPPEPTGRPLRLQFQCAARLRALGSACLILDYEGIGKSDGERSADNIRRDAHAAWAEALRRADGDPGRVVVRGTSIGTLAIACLLQDGERPAAVTMIAPVRAETVAPNYVRSGYGAILAGLADWLVRDAVDVDLLEELRGARMPVLLVVPWEDFLLGHEEVALVEAAAQEAGGDLIVRRNEHVPLALAGRDLLSAEVAFYERRLPALFPDRERAALERWEAWCRASGGDGWGGYPASTFDEGQPARQRLQQVLAESVLPTPDLALAVVLAQVTDGELGNVSDWLDWMPAEAWALEPQALVALVSLDDPAGRLDSKNLSYSIRTTNGAPRETIAKLTESFATLRSDPAARFSGMSFSSDGTVRIDKPAGVLASALSSERDRLIHAGMPEVDADRQVLRLYFKSWGVPERLAADRELEVWDEGRWQPCPSLPDEPWK
jgi:hypothetical protein